ncbi:MAG: translation elongation factor Ts [Caldilineaceae bacterium]
MAEITADMVKELRAATGAGVLDCKKALAEADGDFEVAVEVLRKQGLSTAAKKSSRTTNEGLVGSYVHFSGKVAGLVEVNCESDFVARTEQFQELAKDLAMQVVASKPEFVSREDVPEDMLEHERTIYREQLADSGKPADIVERIIEGKINNWYSEICLLEQPFLKDSGQTVQQVIVDTIAALGENIRVGQFKRVEVGGE